MLLELTPQAYLALCALVKDALEVKSDASPLLERVARELSGAIVEDNMPEDLAEQPDRVEALKRAGFGGRR